MKKVIVLYILLGCVSAVLGQVAIPGYYVIQVEVDTLHGFFGIGHIDSRRLNFDYWHPWGGRGASHFVLNIDGGLYTNASWLTSCPATLIDPYIVNTRIVTNSIVTTWRIPVGGDRIEIRQIFTPQMLYITPSESLETVRIQYSITNLGTTPHIVGLLLNIDVLINNRDDAPMAVGRVYSAVGAMYTYPLIPSYYQGFELSPRQPETYLVARGYLSSFGATAPSIFAFGRQSYLSVACWDESEIDNVVGVPYNDSGVLMRWDPQMVSPGGIRNIITYYGFGSTRGTGGYSISNVVLIPPEGRDCGLAHNPFEVIATVANGVTPPVIVQGCSLCVRNLPSGLSVPESCVALTPQSLYPESSAIGGFNILVDTTRFTRDTTLNFIVCATTTTPGVETPCTTISVFIPYVSHIPPTAELVPPFNQIISCSVGSAVPFRFLVRDNEGIDTLSPRIRFHGTIYDIHDGFFYYQGYTGNQVQIVFPPFDIFMVDGETLSFTLVNVEDIYGCDLVGSLSGYYVVDRRGPYSRDFRPRNGTFITNRREQIRVRIIDVLSGVDITSIQVSVHDRGGDANYSWGSTQLQWSRDTLIFTPPRDYFDGDTVTFCILRANDQARICGPNSFEGENPCVTFYTDFSAPSVITTRPQTGQAVSCELESVFIYLRDINGIDTMSIQLNVNGIVYTITDPNLYFRPDSGILVFYPLTPFTDGQLVNVVLVDVRDNIGNGLATPFSILFRVDRTGPYALNPDPPNWSIVNTTAPVVSMEIADDIAGINPSTIQVRVRIGGSEREFYYGSPVIEYSPGLLTVRVGETGMVPRHGDTVRVCLVDVEDLALYCGSNHLRDTLCVNLRIDIQGPVPSLVTPRNRAVSSCSTQTIIIHLEDALPTDSSTIVLVVGYDTFTVASPELAYNPATRNIEFTPRIPFANGTLVYVHLLSASDSLGNPLNGTTTEWFFTVDRSGPRCFWSYPPSGSASAFPHPTIMFVVRDSLDAIIASSPVVRIVNFHTNGVADTTTLNWASRAMSWNADTLVVNTSSVTFEDGDSVLICLVDVTDSALYCGPNHIAEPYCFYIRMSFSGPSVTPIAPQNNTYVPCDSPAVIVRLADRDGVNASSIRLSVNGTRYSIGTYPSMNYIGQLLTFYPPTHFGNGETVSVSVDSARDGLGNPILEPVRWFFVIDRMPPVALDNFPHNGQMISDPHPEIRLRVVDSLSGVFNSSLTFVVNGDTFRFGIDSSVIWRGDTAVFISRAESLFFTGGETIGVCVIVTDMAFICPPDTLTRRPNRMETCWSFLVSAEGPVARPIYPRHNYYVACPSVDSVFFYLFDPDGVVPTTIRVDINGTIVTYPDPHLILRDTVLIIIPSPPFVNEGNYYVSLLSASDPVGNTLTGAPVVVNFRIDHSPPLISAPLPSDGSTVYVPSPLIQFSAVDSFGRIDPATLVITINDGLRNWRLTYSDTAVSWNGAQFTVNTEVAGISFSGGTVVHICVDSLADYADTCARHYIASPFCWSFNVSSIGPMATLLSPPDSLIFGASCLPPYNFVIHLAGPQAVDSASVALQIISNHGQDTSLVNLSSPLLNYSNDTLYYTHTSGFLDCDTIRISVARANDILGNPVAPNGWVFISDLTPPQVIASVPANGESVYTPAPVIDIILQHDCVGIDTTSFLLTLTADSTDTFVYSNPCIRLIGDTLRLNTSCAGYWFRRFQQVNVCLESISDNTDTCINSLISPYCFNFVVNQGGPVARILSPVPGEFICDLTPILIYINDADTVDPRSLRISVSGIVYTIDSTEISFVEDSLLIFTPAFPYEVETLTVRLLSGSDMLGYSIDSTYTWTFRIDQRGPISTYIAPVPADSVTDNWPEIVLRINDDYHSIDSTTIALLIERNYLSYVSSDTYYVSPDTLVWNRLTNLLRFSTEAAGDTFFSNESVRVCLLSAYDSTGCPEQNPLQGAPVCTTIVIAPGIGPRLSLINPPHDNIYVSCDSSSFGIWARVADPDGVLDSSIVVEIRVGDFIDTLVNNSAPPEQIWYNGRDSLWIHPGLPLANGDMVRVTVVDASDRLGTHIGTPPVWRFFVDMAPPYIVGTDPAGGAIVSSPYPTVLIAVHDAGAGIDPTSVRISINGRIFVWGDRALTYHPDSFFVDFAVAGMEVIGGETTTVCLESLSDSVLLCAPNTISEPYCFSFVGEPGGVVAIPIIPLDSTITACNDQQIRIRLESSHGILPNTITLRVGGVTYTYPDPVHLHIFGDTLVFTPSTPYTTESVRVELLSADDSLHNPLSNPLSYIFFVDTQAPFFEVVSPLNGSVSVDWQQDIMVRVYDNLAGVEVSLCTLTVNGVPYTTSSSALVYNPFDSVFTFTPESAGVVFTEFSVVDVRLYVADAVDYCEPNDTTGEWRFTIGDDDTIGPTINIAAVCSVRAEEAFRLTAELLDPSGIYDDTTDIYGQGIFLVWDTSGVVDFASGRYSGIVQMDLIDSVSALSGIIPGFPEGTPFTYQIVAWDNDFDFANPADRSRSISGVGSCVITNIVPPEVHIVEPLNATYSSCLCQPVIISVVDRDGVILDSLILSVNGQDYRWGDSHLTALGGADSVTVTFTPDQCWDNGDTVRVRVAQVSDRLGNVGRDVLGWYFVIDHEGPRAEAISPANGDIIDPEEFTEIRIRLTDNLSGVDPSSIRVNVNGRLLGSTSPGFVYTNNEIIINVSQANLSFSRGDTVRITLVQANDSPDYCDPNQLQDTIRLWILIKPQTGCKVTPKPFTPNNDGFNDVASFDYPGRYDKEAIIKIYDLNNKLVRKIYRNGYNYEWDGTDDSGNPCRQGAYIYIVEVNGKAICSGTVIIAR